MLIWLFVSMALEFEAEKMEIIRQGTGRVTHLEGEVHLYDENLDIRGAQAWFDQAHNSLVVSDSLRINARDALITGDSLHFDTRDRISHIFRNVVVKREETEIRAPQLIIDHRKRTAYVPRDAQIRNLDEEVLITGGDATYHLSEDRGSITKDPVLTREGGDSDFTITSQRMYLDQDKKLASAAEEVKVSTADADVYADTLNLYYEEDRGQGFGNILIHSPDGRISADSADFKLAGRELEEIFLYKGVSTSYRTEGEDSVKVNSPYLLINLKPKGHETLVFTGGADGTYYWQEAESEEQTEE